MSELKHCAPKACDCSHHFDNLSVKTLQILGDGDKVVGTLASSGKGAGLWLTGPDKQMVAIYSIEGQTALGIYDEKTDPGKGMNLALFVGNGEPTVQFRSKGGDVQTVTLDSIAKHLAGG